jgi:hypothetical protein
LRLCVISVFIPAASQVQPLQTRVATGGCERPYGSSMKAARSFSPRSLTSATACRDG